MAAPAAVAGAEAARQSLGPPPARPVARAAASMAVPSAHPAACAQAPEHSSPEAPAVAAPDAKGAKPGCVMYRCPVCNEFVSSMDEALRHCPSSGSQDAASPQKGPAAAEVVRGAGAVQELALAGANSDEPGPKSEPVAFDEHGRPTIVRWFDPETGAGRTVVQNEDGSQRSFGESTIASLLSAKKEEAAKWASALTKDLTGHQLRGLTHELGQRLLQISQKYNSRLDELKKLSDQLNFEYFGLDGESATERDLDNAYRRLAKQMHPDKNGGTEEAKVRFQKMKERYEELKTKLGGSPSEDSEQPQDAAASGAAPEKGGKRGGGANREEQEAETGGKATEDTDGDKENSEEEEKAKKPADSGYDPSNKESMAKMVSRYAKQLRDMNGKMEVLMKELKKARAYYHRSAAS